MKKEHKEEAISDVETEEEEQEIPVPLVTYVNMILQSFFSKVEKYINNQQIYNSNRLSEHNSYNYNNFKGAISEHKGVLHCEWYDKEDILAEIIDAPLSEPSFTSRMKMRSRPDGFILYEKLSVDFLCISEQLYPNLIKKLRLIRARLDFYMVRDNPVVSLGIVDFLIHSRRVALKNEYQKRKMDVLAYAPVEFDCLETLEKTFIIPSSQNQLNQKNNFNNAPVRRTPIETNTNTAFTGS